MRIFQIDELGREVSDGSRLKLRELADGSLSLSAAELDSRHSLYLELRHDARRPVLETTLASALRERLLLISQPVQPGRTQIGISSIGRDGRIPLNEELLRIRLGNTGDPAEAVQRNASVLPIAPISDMYFEAPNYQILHWTYFTNGDYDQNGHVNVSDITPVGVHLGADSLDVGWPQSRVADGDSNNIVNISDITPIGVNFGTIVEGFIVLSSPNPDGPFTPIQGAVVPYEDGVVPPLGGPREWTYALVNPPYGQYFVVAPTDGKGAGGIHGSAVQYLPPNIPPTALAFHGAAPEEKPGTEIGFDASQSYDPDGTIVEFEWDPEETDNWISTGTEPTLLFTVTALGTYQPRVRITDSEGAQSIYLMPSIRVSLGNPLVRELNSGVEAVGPISAVYLADQRPAVAFLQDYNGWFNTAYIVRASGLSGETWEIPRLGLISPTECNSISMIRIVDELFAYFQHNENICINYYLDNGAGDVDFAELVDSSDLVVKGQQICSFDLFSSPVVAYLEDAADGSGPLLYTSPQLLFEPQVVDPIGCANPSGTQLSAGPGLVYTRVTAGTTGDLAFRRANDAIGNDWGPAINLVSGSTVNTAERCILYHEGRILVVYYNATEQAMYSIASKDASGTEWDPPVRIDSAVGTGNRFALRLVNQFPCVIYADQTDLRYAIPRDRQASAWNQATNIAVSRDGYSDVDMLDTNGVPMAFYIDLEDNQLKATIFK